MSEKYRQVAESRVARIGLAKVVAVKAAKAVARTELTLKSILDLSEGVELGLRLKNKCDVKELKL